MQELKPRTHEKAAETERVNAEKTHGKTAETSRIDAEKFKGIRRKFKKNR